MLHLQFVLLPCLTLMFDLRVWSLVVNLRLRRTPSATGPLSVRSTFAEPPSSAPLPSAPSAAPPSAFTPEVLSFLESLLTWPSLQRPACRVFSTLLCHQPSLLPLYLLASLKGGAPPANPNGTHAASPTFEEPLQPSKYPMAALLPCLGSPDGCCVAHLTCVFEPLRGTAPSISGSSDDLSALPTSTPRDTPYATPRDTPHFPTPRDTPHSTPRDTAHISPREGAIPASNSRESQSALLSGLSSRDKASTHTAAGGASPALLPSERHNDDDTLSALSHRAGTHAAAPTLDLPDDCHAHLSRARALVWHRRLRPTARLHSRRRWTACDAHPPRISLNRKRGLHLWCTRPWHACSRL